MENFNTKRNYYIKYTLIFGIMCIVVYGYFLVYHKTFIDGGQDKTGDGLMQHYTALCYYAKYLRGILKSLFIDHKFVIPEWSFSIGYGSDILTTLHYYVIGDPFNLLSIAIPLKYMPYYYSFMILLRLYCAGIAFSAYCFYMNEKGGLRLKNDIAVLAGAFLYLFGMYGMRAGISHPYFINPMIYFPLLLLGVEKIINRENPVLLMITVAISACSNFYFFYMLVILTVLYALMRLVFIYGIREIKKIAFQVFRIGISAVVGLGMGMVLFLPVVLVVFQDSRFGDFNLTKLFYSSKYYTSLPAAFISPKNPGAWCMLGFASIAFIAIVLLFFKKKEHFQLKIAFVCLSVFILVPAINCILNAFAYAASRWIWAYAFLIAYILVCMWTDMVNISKKQTEAVCISLFLYLLIAFGLDNSRTANAAFSMGCAFIILGICQLDNMKKGIFHIRKECLIVFVLLVNIGINANYSFLYKNSDILEKYMSPGEANACVLDTFDSAVAQAAAEIEDEDVFYRFAQSIRNNNATLLSGLHSTQYYWSLSNSCVIEANDELGILGFTHNIYYDMNSRTRLTSLANVKYYVSYKDRGHQYAPWGFEYVGTYSTSDGKFDVYKNKYVLPFGYTYDNVLDQDQFENMTSVQKEAAMLEGAYVEEDTPLPVAEAEMQSLEVPYEITCSNDDVSIQDESFVVTAKGASVVLSFDGMPQCETFLQISGLTYKGCSPLDLYQDDTPFDPLNKFTQEAWNKKTLLEKKKLQYKNRNWTEDSMLWITVKGTDAEDGAVGDGLWLLTPDYTWYSGKEDYTVNLRYSDSGKKSIEIFFPSAGIYSFRDIKIECLPISGYENGIEKLKAEHLENLSVDTDHITGEISVKKNKLLCLTIPFVQGWTAFVDGKKVPIVRTNYMYSGIMLESGEHTIELTYQTPGLRVGAAISVISILIMFVVSGKYFRKQKRMILCTKENTK